MGRDKWKVRKTEGKTQSLVKVAFLLSWILTVLATELELHKYMLIKFIVHKTFHTN